LNRWTTESGSFTKIGGGAGVVWEYAGAPSVNAREAATTARRLFGVEIHAFI
jgi:hypothetical protein